MRHRYLCTRSQSVLLVHTTTNSAVRTRLQSTMIVNIRWKILDFQIQNEGWSPHPADSYCWIASPIVTWAVCKKVFKTNIIPIQHHHHLGRSTKGKNLKYFHQIFLHSSCKSPFFQCCLCLWIDPVSKCRPMENMNGAYKISNPNPLAGVEFDSDYSKFSNVEFFDVSSITIVGESPVLLS